MNSISFGEQIYIYIYGAIQIFCVYELEKLDMKSAKVKLQYLTLQSMKQAFNGYHFPFLTQLRCLQTNSNQQQDQSFNVAFHLL